jgi:probable rRNA maturation factor
MIHLLVRGGPYEGVSRAEIMRRAGVMLQALRLQAAELSIVLTGEDEIRKLNWAYRKKNRPTDVLAFPQDDPPGSGPRGLLGDIVVSVPTARTQAARRGWDLASEVTMLIAHGLLHLIGWDHDTPAKDRRMRRETERLRLAAAAAPHRVREKGTPANSGSNADHPTRRDDARALPPRAHESCGGGGTDDEPIPSPARVTRRRR